MSFYICREASKFWKKFCAETTTEINLLAENWKFILGGLICQYIHGLARGVHYFHRPGPILQDVGFFLLPICSNNFSLFHSISHKVENALMFVVAMHAVDFPSIHFEEQEDSHDPDMVQGVSIFSCLSNSSIITFFSTQLPGPNYHCREGSKLARLPRPDNILEVLLLVPRGVLYGCGDLIFSSHMIFFLVFIRTYHKYGTRSFLSCDIFLGVLSQVH